MKLRTNQGIDTRALPELRCSFFRGREFRLMEEIWRRFIEEEVRGGVCF